MGDLLKAAGIARGQSIKLSMESYGKDLADELLKHAQDSETLFRNLQQALNGGDEKVIIKYLHEAQQQQLEGEKAKAWWWWWWWCFLRRP